MGTKIIITIGPASGKPRILKEIINAGADIIRINLKYISIKNYEKIRKKIMNSVDVKILIDIKKRTILKKIINTKVDSKIYDFAVTLKVSRPQTPLKKKSDLLQDWR